MKRKLFVTLIALVVVVAIVGSAFAVYAKDAAPKTIVLSTGDAVTLSFTNIDNNFSLSQLRPNHSVTRSLTLSASNPIAGTKGEFKVAIAAASEAEADVALAAAIRVSATGTTNQSGEYTATHTQLTAPTNADWIDFEDIPTNLTLTFSIAEADFAAAAEGAVTVTLTWTVKDSFAADANAYYLVGTYGGETNWSPVSGSVVINDASEGNTVQETVTLAQGDVIKVIKGTAGWFNWGGAGTSDYHFDGDGNFVIDTAGSYTIYVKDNYGYENETAAYLGKNE